MFLELNAYGQSYLNHRKLQVYFFNYSVFAGFGKDLSSSHSLNISASVEPVRISTECRDTKRDELGLFILLNFYTYLLWIFTVHFFLARIAQPFYPNWSKGNLDGRHGVGRENRMSITMNKKLFQGRKVIFWAFRFLGVLFLLSLWLGLVFQLVQFVCLFLIIEYFVLDIRHTYLPDKVQKRQEHVRQNISKNNAA